MTRDSTATPTSASIAGRLHHLDALRATAMLLGIVLHASLAYTGGPWIVRDDGHAGFAVVFFAIHGFRMQLFFLLSGFFTALIWRRLGLVGLLKQRAARIALPLLVGMFTIVPLVWLVVLSAGSAEAADPSVALRDGLSASRAATESAPKPHPAAVALWFLFRFPVFHHLWFLWFLCWMMVGFALIAWCAERGPGRRVLGWIREPSAITRTCVGSMGALVWLVPVSAVTYAIMDFSKDTPGFGADTSTGLIPLPGILLHYALFFTMGALLFEVPDAMRGFSRRWIVALICALVIFPLAVGFALGAPWSHAMVPSTGAHRLLSWTGQALYAWLASIALLGLFARLFSSERTSLRYLADSAYWLYLAHLPLVVAGQVLLRNVAWPPAVKFVVL
ncbi:MAG: acyltransferase family protein, partial [Limnohabitans sp.]|nr:acyltransferase family protein [Limnohabitans sp.]